jgi:hypothetical protein
LNGFGENLFGTNDAFGTRSQQFQSAYDALIQANQTSWDVGFQFSLPVGLRQAMSLKRNLELQLPKARAVLAAQELEISHEVGNTFSTIDTWYALAQTNFDRQLAAQSQMDAVQRAYDAGRISIDLVLRTQANLSAAQTSYYTALTRYNQAITDLRLRKGTLLEENSIFLAEGEWTPEAKEEAMRRAWARAYASPAPKLRDTTEPLSVPGLGPMNYAVPAVNTVPADVPPVPPATQPPLIPPQPIPDPKPGDPFGSLLSPSPSGAREPALLPAGGPAPLLRVTAP